MKRFLIKVGSLSLFIILSLFALFVARYFYVKSISWTLPSAKHIVFMGASHIERGINPEYYPSSINLASSSERYMFTYLKLNELINANPQIDTLFLEFAPTDIQKNTDAKYYSKEDISYFLPSYFPFFSKEEWLIYSNEKLNVLYTIAQKELRNIPLSIYGFGGYIANEGFIDIDKTPGPKIKWTERGHEINYKYLDKIIEACNENSIEIIFIYMPMHNKNYFYDIDYFYSTYEQRYDNIAFLDYSDWHCPDRYRYDSHHLNKIGADNFTKQLKLDLSNK